MITFVQVNNPFQVVNHNFQEVTKDESSCTSVLQWLKENKSPDWDSFDVPTIVLVDGEPVLQKDYGKELKDGSIVTLLRVVQGLVNIIIAIVVILIAVALTLAIVPDVGNTGDTPEADPVYSLSGQKNSNKLGQAIPSHYGQIKNWPDYAALPYNQYIGNNQYQFSLYCLGQGSYSVEDIQIEDTPIANYREVDYQIYEPGQNPTLFPTAVVTSTEVGSIELYGENEDDFAGWVGGFIANDTETLISKIEVDVSLPSGLYFSNDQGTLDEVTVNATFEYQQIDDQGAAIGSWQLLSNFTETLADNTPQRYTISQSVAQGRYQVRAKRVGDDDDSHRVGDKVVWESLRGFLDADQDFGDVTLMAVRALATNNLNNQSNARLNLRQTRKLPVWSGTSWSLPQTTRNPIWATLDVFRSDYGAQMADEFLDLETFLELATKMDSLGKTFDWSFANASSVWVAAKSILSSARCIPMLNGSQITAIEDKQRVTKSAVFTPFNMLKGSFKWDVSLFKLNEEDSVEVEYLDEDTWKPETILCKIGVDQGRNPKKIKLVGITNRDRAYREGLYYRAKTLYQREVVKFDTGLEGNIPLVGQLISVSHDVPRWTHNAGLVIGESNGVVTLSEPLIDIDPLLSYKIAFRRKDGSASPHYDLTPLTNKTVSVADLNEDFVRLSTQEKIFYQIGTEETIEKLCRVKKIKPSGNNQTVSVELVNNDDRIYSFDGETAPAKGARYLPPVIPDLPAVGSVSVAAAPNALNDILVSWPPAVGAQSYIIEISYNSGSTYNTLGTTSSSSLSATVNSGSVIIRVAAINTGQGAWSSWSGSVGVPSDPPMPPTNLRLQSPFSGASADLVWDSSALATGYAVEVKRASDSSTLGTYPVTAPSFSYDLTKATTDFAGLPERTLVFNVFSSNAIGSSNPAQLSSTNPAPLPPLNIGATIQSQDASSYQIEAHWDLRYEPDIKEYVVWASSTQGFTAGSSNEVARGSFSQVNFTISKTGSPSTLYYRVAIVDQWGDDYVLSSEKSLSLS